MVFTHMNGDIGLCAKLLPIYQTGLGTTPRPTRKHYDHNLRLLSGEAYS